MRISRPNDGNFDFSTFAGNLKEFRSHLLENESTVSKIRELRQRVEKFSSAFPMPGLEDR